MAGKQQVPTGVKVISVLYYIGMALELILGILFLVGAGIVGSVVEEIPVISLLGSGFLVLIGIILIGISVLSFFVARGLWNGNNWARIVTIIFSGLGALSAISSLVQGRASSIIGLAIHFIIIGYLLFSSDVKKAFT